MLIYIIIIVIIVIIFLLFPKRMNKDTFLKLKNYDYAHRGLHNNSYPENSLGAFENAISHGFGIELDVHITKDGVLCVHHDESLMRSCKSDLIIENCFWQEIKDFKLFKTNYTILTLEEVLVLVNGKVPLIIEIKQPGVDIQVTKKTMERLNFYDGLFCVESFNPMAIRYIKKNYPKVVRGQLAKNFFVKESRLNFLEKLSLTFLLTNVLNRPHFIAYDVKKYESFFLKFIKFLGAKLVFWTVKDVLTYQKVKKSAGLIIFEGFIPKK